MKKAILLLVLIISAFGLSAQTIGTYKFVTYNDYELQYTVTKLSPAECSVKGINLTSENAIDIITIADTMEIEGTVFTVTSVAASGFEYFYSVKKFELPNTIKTISDRAFYYCNFATEIAIPESVTTIGNEAFYGCKIAEAIIPNGVTKINNAVFRHCSNLSNVVIPNTVTSIGNFAFNYCTSLTEIELPESITSISDYAFSECNNLSLVICNATVPPTCKNIFYHTHADLIIRVPAESLELYRSTEPWNKYNVKAIGDDSEEPEEPGEEPENPGDEPGEEPEEESIEEKVVSLDIYPNPVNDRLVIKTEVEIDEVIIYDVFGRQQSTVNGQQTSSIDVANLNNGIYFVKVRTENGEIVKRFVKE